MQDCIMKIKWNIIIYKQSKHGINPHIDNIAIPFVTHVLTRTMCLLGLSVGVEEACKASKIFW